MELGNQGIRRPPDVLASEDFKVTTHGGSATPPILRTDRWGLDLTTKQEIRSSLRKARREHVRGMPENMRGLVFHRPPAPALELIPDGSTVGLYSASAFEAPTRSYAQFLFETGHPLALPRFSSKAAPMEFAHHKDPFEQSDLELGPYEILQPAAGFETCVPQVLFVPLVGFTENGERLGQGGGHYDRWLANHADTIAIGLAWDCQLADALPVETHDRPLAAIVTPTRIYGPFS